MRNPYLLFLLLSFFILLGCSGSDVYQGDWKATNTDGERFTINFQPKSFSIKDSIGKTVKYEYTQNSIKIENGIKTYGINLKDGRTYTITFPIVNETTKAIISPENSSNIYTLSRADFITYDELYKLSK